MAPSDTLGVSIIIPTLNAAKYLPRLANAFAAQSEPPGEVLVVDSASEDGTQDMVRAAGWDLLEIPRSQFDHGGTRNLAARTSSGEVLVFMTQDAVPMDDSWLVELLRPLRALEAEASYSRQVAWPSASPIERYARETNYPLESSLRRREDVARKGIRAYALSNVSSATLRSTFERVGGFPERVILNEDNVYASKVIGSGGTVAYVAASRVWHSHDYGLVEQLRRYFDIGVSHATEAEHFAGGTVGGAGLQFVLGQLRHLLETRALTWIPRLTADTAARFVGYYAGRNYRMVPPRIRPSLSMHRTYWSEPR